MALDIYAKQIPGIEIGRMDVATLLAFMNTVAAKGAADATLTAKLGDIWTAFAQAADAYDIAYNPSRKDLLSDVLKGLDDARDKSQGAWHVAILAALKSPNAEKQWIAQRLVQLYKDYHLDTADEYMKQTTNIQQMIQVIEADAAIMAALPGMGLDDYLTDLKAKNEAFNAKMDERTTGTIGYVGGTVAAARAEVESKYRTLVRMVNVVSSYEGGGVLDQFILVITAEIEHYRQILARKGGGSSSSSSSQQGGTSSQQGGTNSGTEQGGSEQGGSEQGGSEQGGSEQGGGLPSDPGGEVGDDNGGGDNGGGGLPPSGGGEVGDNSGGGGGGLPGSGGEG